MKIEHKKEYTFKDLDPGDTFYYTSPIDNERFLYVKFSNRYGQSLLTINALNLSNNSLESFGNLTLVEKVNSKIMVEQ